MIIRMATKNDVADISMLWKDMVKESRPDWSPNPDWWGKLCLGLMDSGLYHIAVCEIDGNLVGFIDGLIMPEPSTGKLHGVAQHFYVRPEHRGTGIAKKLHEEILFVSMREKAETIELFCFPESVDYWQGRGFDVARVMMRRAIDV